jgi:hypothetical protein
VKGVFVEQFQHDVWSRWSPSEATKQTPVGGETFSYGMTCSHSWLGTR